MFGIATSEETVPAGSSACVAVWSAQGVEYRLVRIEPDDVIQIRLFGFPNCSGDWSDSVWINMCEVSYDFKQQILKLNYFGAGN